jgi:flavodoxin
LRKVLLLAMGLRELVWSAKNKDVIGLRERTQRVNFLSVPDGLEHNRRRWDIQFSEDDPSFPKSDIHISRWSIQFILLFFLTDMTSLYLYNIFFVQALSPNIALVSRQLSLHMTSFVVYATETGTSKAVATEIGTKTGIPVVDVKKFRFEDIDEYSVVIFVVSNYGRGEPTPSSRPTWDQFLALKVELPDLKFAVFTCGSSKFPDSFVGFGRKLEAKLKEFRATQLGTLGIRDAAGQHSTDFDRWVASLGLPSA